MNKKIKVFCGYINKEAKKLNIPFEIYNLINFYYTKQFYDIDILNLKKYCEEPSMDGFITKALSTHKNEKRAFRPFSKSFTEEGPIEIVKCYISIFGPDILFTIIVYNYFINYKSLFYNKKTYSLLAQFLDSINICFYREKHLKNNQFQKGKLF